MRQQEKTIGVSGGSGFGKMCLAGVTGWILGCKLKSRRVTKTMTVKHTLEQKRLYNQYYNDVYKLQEQNAELALASQKLQEDLRRLGELRETEAIQRDYEEFKLPDVDGDDRISRAEFSSYVRNYLSNYPGLAEKDYPKFEEFDHDNDGYVSFAEYSHQMALQVTKAEAERKRALHSSDAGGQHAYIKTNAVKSLYGEATQVDNFDDLYANYRRAMG